MKVSNIEYLYGCPYITRGNISKQMSMSLNAIDVRIKELKEQIAKGRYSEFAIIKDGGFVMINYLVWIDYMGYRERLKEKNLCKSVPPFEPRKIASEIGWYGTYA